MSTEKHVFTAEVQELLNLMVHSLYSQKDIFLRELVSNSSDALDRLRLEGLTAPDLPPRGRHERPDTRDLGQRHRDEPRGSGA